MRSDRLQPALVAALLFCVYAATAPRTVMMEDDGLFILSSYFMGVAHPPGYPLHSLLGKLFTLLPVGTVAYRVHLLSALFGALSCALLWLCARALLEGRLAAWLAALALGLSPAFWSQSIIAEVYTLNTFFFFALLWLALRGGSLALMAFLFGLSLANHWPLMLLGAPALAAALWPRRLELLRRLPLLVALLAVGLLPYAWMVMHSRTELMISFAGPLDSLREAWFFISRSGYAEVDASATATMLDRVLFLRYFGAELLLQFALLGTLLAGLGFWAQWRLWPRHVALALSLAFVMPSVVLIFLLGFDYDAFRKHIFHVYPLPAYGVAALWLALGFSWVVRNWHWGPRASLAAGAGLLVLVAAAGSFGNLRSRYDWTERYATAVLSSLPQDAILVLAGDSDFGPIAYFHLVENMRPDVTLYQAQGLVLGNRLVHPLRIETANAIDVALRTLIEREGGRIAFTQRVPDGHGRRHRGLYLLVEQKGADRLDLPPQAVHFFQESVLGPYARDPWTRLAQEKLRERIGGALAMHFDRTRPPDAATTATFRALAEDYFGALGVAEGLLANRGGYAPREVAGYLERARELMPGDVAKDRRALFFELRGYLRLGQGDLHGAAGDLQAAVAIWPSPANRAAASLADLQKGAKP